MNFRNPTEQFIIWIGGVLLAFNGGFMNGNTLQGSVSATTTHMTGNATKLAIAIASGDVNKIAKYGGLIVFYTFGSFSSGFMVPHQNFSICESYGRVFILGSIILIGASIGDIENINGLYYNFMITYVAGLQNGMVSRYSGNILRTTHMTGICTDIGVNLGRIFMGVYENVWRVKILISLLFGFWLGGLCSGKSYGTLGRYQILISAGFFFTVGACYITYLNMSKYNVPLLIGAVGREEDIQTILEAKHELYTQPSDGLLIDDDVDYVPADESITLLSDEDNTDSDLKTSLLDNKTSTNTSHITSQDKLKLELPTLLLSTSVVNPPVSVAAAHSPPPLHQRDDIEFFTILLGSMLLALNAGYINVLAEESTKHLFVTHITGSVTSSGLRLAHNEFGAFSVYMSLIMCFTLGSFVVGIMVPSSVFRLGLSYFRVLVLCGLTLLGGTVLHILREQSLYFDYAAAITCGMQNAMVTKYSGGVIRTTHCTGSFTDIGGTLGRMLTGHFADAWQLTVLVPLVSCYVLGGIIGYFCLEILNIYAMLVSVSFYFFVAIGYLTYIKSLPSVAKDLTLFQILFGKYTLKYRSR